MQRILSSLPVRSPVATLEEGCYSVPLFRLYRGEEIWAHLVLRAAVLASMLTKETTDVYFMDGHGRFLFCLVQAIFCRYGSAFLDALTLHWVDIDKDVHNWHVSAYGGVTKGLEFHHGSILAANFDRTSVVYLNFCGIAEQWPQVRAALSDKVRPGLKNVMLSYSTARAAGKHAPRYAQQLKNDCLEAVPLREALQGVPVDVDTGDGKDNIAQTRAFMTYVISRSRPSSPLAGFKRVAQGAHLQPPPSLPRQQQESKKNVGEESVVGMALVSSSSSAPTTTTTNACTPEKKKQKQKQP